MQTRALRIAIADDEQDMRSFYKESLLRLGHQVVSVAETGKELVEQCRKIQPDLVITDIKMPDMDGIDAALGIYKDKPIPVIVVSGYHDRPTIERAEADPIMAYLVKPIQETDLKVAIGMAQRRFEQFQALLHETNDLKQAMENRKIIDRAKVVLMKKAALDEQTAFRRMQKLAMDKKMKMVDVARGILTAEEVMKPPVMG